MNNFKLNELLGFVTEEEIKKYNEIFFNKNLSEIILRVDHVSLATKKESSLKDLYELFVKNKANIFEKIHKWPKINEDNISIDFHKKIFSIGLKSFFVVGVSSVSKNDQISKFMGDFKGIKIHHIAFLVHDFNLALDNFSKKLGYIPLEKSQQHQDNIKQVFLSKGLDSPLIEIVWRKDTESTKLIHDNIVSLSSSLRHIKI